ncbi:hypothetical protein DJ031_04215 [bacterium endosymbiont of Escarpia laminata]|nr:MAG: hypothetical protein DJ031_04215 [bacterium endosymbiont of Escarpia laminata]
MEDQWQPLWEDIEEKSNQRLLQQQRDKFSHFTGAIVIQQKPTNVDEVPKYEIIDGQQRLTTFQIILCALRNICASLEYDDIADEVDGYVFNRGMLSKDYAGEQYKLIPTDFDRFSLKSVVESSTSNNLIETKGRIRPAFEYFSRKIERYSDGDRSKLLSLFHSVLNDFGLVQILIDSDDEPEMIFESLNGRGKSLLQFDLLRNNLFLRTRISEQDRDSLYRDYWSHFETDYWEKEVKLGRRKIIISELFFQHFLMSKLSTDSVAPLFKAYQRQYRKNLDHDQGSDYELSELCRYSKVYKEITECDASSPIGEPMRFYKLFDITSLHPFVLYIKNEINLQDSESEYVFRVLEAYTLRRMLCTTQGHKNYNKFFSEVIRKLKRDGFSIERLVSILKEQSSNTSRWPSDHEVKTALHGHWSEINVNRNVVRYILYRIELYKRGSNRFVEKDELPFNQFTLEHILPEKWKTNWVLNTPDGPLRYEDMFSEEYKENTPLWDLFSSNEGLEKESYLEAFELAQERDGLKQCLGNLTVLTGKLNSSLSNSAYEEKRESLFSNSTLFLSKEIYKKSTWDVHEIRNREEELYGVFCDLWPGASWFAENIT